jgi:hypothetical protein
MCYDMVSKAFPRQANRDRHLTDISEQEVRQYRTTNISERHRRSWFVTMP